MIFRRCLATYLLICCAFVALFHCLKPNHAIAAEAKTYRRIVLSETSNPTTLPLDDGGLISFYQFRHPNGFAGAGLLTTYYVVYTKPHPGFMDRFLPVAIFDHAQNADHFEASTSGGDCQDTDTVFFSNGQQVIAVSLQRKNADKDNYTPGDGSGDALMRIFLGERYDQDGVPVVPYATYYFDLKENETLKGVGYCSYENIEAAVGKALRKFEKPSNDKKS